MFTAEQLKDMNQYVEWLYQYTQIPINQCKLMFVSRYPGCGSMFDHMIQEWLD